MTPTLEFLAVGSDHSINHGAFVALDPEGKLADVWALVSLARHAREGMSRFPPSVTKGGDPDQIHMNRLFWLQEWFAEARCRIGSRLPDCVFLGVEDYAYARSQGAHQIGEVGGLQKLAFLSSPKVGLRLYSPGQVKLFATGDGGADKDKVIDAVEKRWGVSFRDYGEDGEYPPEEDLCDAYVLARMVWTEAHLRAGRMRLSDLPEYERRVFLQVGSHKVPLIDRDWIRGPVE